MSEKIRLTLNVSREARAAVDKLRLKTSFQEGRDVTISELFERFVLGLSVATPPPSSPHLEEKLPSPIPQKKKRKVLGRGLAEQKVRNTFKLLAEEFSYGDLIEASKINQATVSSVLRKLEGEGLLEKIPHSKGLYKKLK